jgi:hypothetical protein
VYVTSWNSNTTTMNLMDVQFKISMDLNNDGVYEVQQSSAVLNQTYIEVGVFHLGGPIASDADHFRFKIEAFKIDNGTSIPLIYTADGSIPVNQGSSEEGALNSWSYDATLNSSSDLACNINYMYFIS